MWLGLSSGGRLCVPEARAALQNVVDWGLVDTFDNIMKAPKLFVVGLSANGFANGNGLRIDMVYATQSLAQKCSGHS